MKQFIQTLLFIIIVSVAFGQAQRKVNVYLSTQYNNTIYDNTTGNNPWSVGLGAQIYFNNNSKFKPTIELTGDIYLVDDKVYRFKPDSVAPPVPYKDVRGMINLFAGSIFTLTQTAYLSFLAGPSFIGNEILVGIKPSLGFYFSKTKKWTGKISYINIFNRDKKMPGDFGSISLAVGFKLY
ncbi:MAG: hypothetical protein ABIQ31_04125 [Ferruginibacter sp.]